MQRAAISHSKHVLRCKIQRHRVDTVSLYILLGNGCYKTAVPRLRLVALFAIGLRSLYTAVAAIAVAAAVLLRYDCWPFCRSLVRNTLCCVLLPQRSCIRHCYYHKHKHAHSKYLLAERTVSRKSLLCYCSVIIKPPKIRVRHNHESTQPINISTVTDRQLICDIAGR